MSEVQTPFIGRTHIYHIAVFSGKGPKGGGWEHFHTESESWRRAIPHKAFTQGKLYRKSV